MVGISVVVPVYRGRRYLAETLTSIPSIAQGLPVEVIVVEDGSPELERVEDIARNAGSSYYLLNPNQGVAHARRYGASQSQFSDGFIMFLDQDDVLLDGSLDTLVQILESRPEFSWVVSNALLRFPDGSERPLYVTKHPSLKLSDLKMFNHIVTPSQVLIRLSTYRSCRNIPNAMPYPGADDWILWLSLLSESHRALYVPEPQVLYRMHGANVSTDIPSMRQSERYVVAEWFPRLGFSRWDQRRYQARVRLDHLLLNRHAGLAAELAHFLGPDPLAAIAALWYFTQHRMKGLV